MKRLIVTQALALSRRHPVLAAATVLVCGAWIHSQYDVSHLQILRDLSSECGGETGTILNRHRHEGTS